ncbi:MAG: choice-of-anchor C family protein [Pyrinomonadaceae bacterium]
MRTRLVLVTMLIVAMTPAVFGQVNGSFEDGPCGGSFDSLPAGNNNITGWTIGGGGVDLICSLWQASDADRSIDLNLLTPGSLSQDLETVAGLTYAVTFDMSGSPDGGSLPPAHPWYSPTNKALGVSADGSAPELFNYDTAVEGNSRPDMRWTTNTYYFAATDAETTLTFASQIPGAFGPTLDNVTASVLTQVCHRNKGSKGSRTLTVGPPAVAAHLAHGDTPGPCAE